MDSICQWVENPLLCADEDELFEGDSSKPSLSVKTIVDCASGTGDDPLDKHAFYGDELDVDSEDEIGNPLDVIRAYADRSFPGAQLLDFSGCVDRPSDSGDRSTRRKGDLGSLKSPGELRNLILHLRQQLQVLEQQDVVNRAALSESSETVSLPLESLRLSLTLLSSRGEVCRDSAVGASAAAEPSSVRTVSDDVSLERRVAKLEKYLGPCHFHGDKEGLWSIVESLRLRLLSADPSFWLEVHAAMDSASSKLDSMAPLAKVVDLCELLRRLRAIEIDATSVPILVARLRTLKQSFEDASGLATGTRELAQRCETLVSMKTENDSLMAQLRTNLEKNAARAERNVQLLEHRVRALSVDPDFV